MIEALGRAARRRSRHHRRQPRLRAGRPWLAAAGCTSRAGPRGRGAIAARDGPLAAALAGWRRRRRVSLAYPGVWLREDIWATHGHYLDRQITIPTFERIAAGAMARAGRRAARRGSAARTTTRPRSRRCTHGSAAPTSAPPRWAAAAPPPRRRLAADGRGPLRGKAPSRCAAGFARRVRHQLAGLGPGDRRPVGAGRHRGDGRHRRGARRSTSRAHVIFGHTHRRARGLDGPRRVDRSGRRARQHRLLDRRAPHRTEQPAQPLPPRIRRAGRGRRPATARAHTGIAGAKQVARSLTPGRPRVTARLRCAVRAGRRGAPRLGHRDRAPFTISEPAPSTTHTSPAAYGPL